MEDQEQEQTMSRETIIQQYLRVNGEYSDETFYNILTQQKLTEGKFYRELEEKVLSERAQLEKTNSDECSQIENNIFEDEDLAQ